MDSDSASETANSFKRSAKTEFKSFGPRGKLSCHSCDVGHCEGDENADEDAVVPERVCEKAIRCYTAHVRDVSGDEMKSKGRLNIFFPSELSFPKILSDERDALQNFLAIKSVHFLSQVV